jgi:hypothetical protein
MFPWPVCPIHRIFRRLVWRYASAVIASIDSNRSFGTLWSDWSTMSLEYGW